MAEGFITRRGGVSSEQTATPSILDFSTASTTSIKFKLRNNDSVAATLVYRFGTLTGDGESISVAANTTTAEITLTVPTITAPTKLFVTANATGKVKSNVEEQEFPVPIIYTAATGGTTLEYNDGGKRYKSHTFTSSGNFVVSQVGNGDRNKVDYLIVAAGGGGSGGTSGVSFGPGGGAGQHLTGNAVVTATTFSVDIGAGGTGTNTTATNGGNGGSSSFGSIVASTTGGQGGQAPTTGGNSGNGFTGGTGIAPSSGGGAGSSANGGNAPNSSTGGNGGNGLSNTFRNGTSETRAGGGGGGGDSNGGSGGSGGGGKGTDGFSNTATSATVNSGSGGGGAGVGNFNVGNGGSGIVIIRYEIAPSA